MGWLAVVAIGCTGKVGSATGDTGAAAVDDALVFEPANDFVHTAAVTLTPVEIAVQQHASVDWSALTTDLRGWPHVPDETEQLALLRFGLPLADLELAMVAGLDSQADATETYLFDSLGLTTTDTDQFDITAIPFDAASLFVEDPASTWVLAAFDYPDGRAALRMVTAVVPDAVSGNRHVAVTPADTQLTVTIDLHTPAAILAPAGEPHVSLDFDALAVGGPDDDVWADELQILHFPGTIAEAEAVPLQLAEQSDVWTVGTGGATHVADLSSATNALGDPFPGFSVDGTWLVALQPGGLFVPLPAALAVVVAQ